MATHLNVLLKPADGDNDTEWKSTIEIIIQHTKALCQDKIGAKFAANALKGADCIIVTFDTVGGSEASIRGFAALEFHKYDNNEFEGGYSHAEDKETPPDKFHPYIYIDLICTQAVPMKKNIRSIVLGEHMVPGGATMLKWIQKYAIKEKYAYVKLKALEHVITYYYRYGWRFITACSGGHPMLQKKYADIIDALKKLYSKISGGAANPQPTYEQGEQLTELLAGLKSALPGIYTWKDAADHASSGGHQAHVEAKREDGYKMIWCPGAPGSLAPPHGGHKRRKKKKTKKKALKKRHRRRKTRRHRRKRRRKHRRRKTKRHHRRKTRRHR